MNRAERRSEKREADKAVARVTNDTPIVRDAVHETLATVALTAMDEAARQATQIALKSLLQSPGFANGVKEIVREAAMDCAKEILAEDLGDLEARVRRIVEEHWETSVSAAAHQVLSDALASVKRRIQGL